MSLNIEKYNYTLKQQRDIFMIAMRNDVRLREYPLTDHPHPFDQYAASKMFRHRWNNISIRFIFNFLLPFLFFFSDIITPIWYVAKTLFHARKKFDGERLFLLHELRLYTISKRCGLLKNDDVWYRSPVDIFTIPETFTTLEIYDFVNVRDILISAYQAILLHLRTVKELGYDKYFLSYNAYLWCLNDLALRKLPNNTELIYCNIYDRFAVLFDNLPQKNKVLVQHGSMFMHHKLINESPYYDYITDHNFYVPSGYYRQSPTKVYCFTEDDEVALRSSVIKGESKFVYIGYDFHPTLKTEKKSVLIVGNYNMYADVERSVIERLQDLDINVYLKAHPNLPDSLYEDMIKQFKFFLSKEKGQIIQMWI